MNIKYLFVAIIIQIGFACSAFTQNINNHELALLIDECNSFSIENAGEINWNEIEILFTMEYEGSLPAADMLYFSNSIMVLRSLFYTLDSKTENRFFKYTLNGEILKIIFIDTRIDIARHLDIALSQIDRNLGIQSVDYLERSITYNIRQNKILFGNFYFFLNN